MNYYFFVTFATFLAFAVVFARPPCGATGIDYQYAGNVLGIWLAGSDSHDNILLGYIDFDEVHPVAVLAKNSDFITYPGQLGHNGDHVLCIASR